jgi:CubicO group peptidase (beta-lactamase class C family)
MDLHAIRRRRLLAASVLLLPPAASHGQSASGLVPERLTSLQSALRTAYPEVRAFLIQRGGSTGFTYYRPDTDATQRLNVASVTKSVMSLLVGIAIGQRAIRDVDEPLSAFFPEAAGPNLDRVTLRHLLTMSSGFDPGPSPDDYNDFARRLYSPGWLAHALARRIVAPPGRNFVYSNTDAHLVAVMLARRLDRPLEVFARERLFTPLGIHEFHWPAGTEGIPSGASDLRLAAPDLVRLGQLMLQAGRWQDRQLVPREYVAQATQRQVASNVPPRGRPDLWGYGYLWWTASTPGDEHPAFAAAGYGGQYVYVVPALDLVVAALTQQQSRAVARRVAEFIRTEALATVVR